MCHHAEDVAHTSDTSTISKQILVPAQERERVEAKGFGSLTGPCSALEHCQLLLVFAASLSWLCRVGVNHTMGSAPPIKCLQDLESLHFSLFSSIFVGWQF